MDISKLIFGGVLLAGVMAQNIDKVILFSMDGIFYLGSLVAAFVISKAFRQALKRQNG